MTIKTCFVDASGYLCDYKTGDSIRRATGSERSESESAGPTGAFECDPDAVPAKTVAVLLGLEGTGCTSTDDPVFGEWVSYVDSYLGKALADEIDAGLDLEIESRGDHDQIQTDHVSGGDPVMVWIVRGAVREAWDKFCSEAV